MSLGKIPSPVLLFLVVIEKIYRKLMVTDDMVEYVLKKYGKKWK
ncbi:hypothetical protein Tco_1512162, partial [Tanacetum coccineum]